MINRRKQMARRTALAVFLLSILTWMAWPTRQTNPAPVSQPAPTLESPAIELLEVSITGLVNSPDMVAPSDPAPVAPARERIHTVSANARMLTQETPPAEPPPAAPAAASATAEATPPESPSAEPPAPAPPAVASIVPPPTDPTGLAAVRFRDRVGPMYKLVQLTCVVDGVPVSTGRSQSGVLFDRKLAPGNHNVSVVAEYQGFGAGVFSYLEGYKFSGRASRSFAVRTAETTQVTINAFEKGPMVPFEERLALSVDVR